MATQRATRHTPPRSRPPSICPASAAQPTTMAAKFVVLLACLALSSAHLVRREAESPTLLQELEQQASAFGKTFSEQISSLSSSKNTQEFNKALKDGTDSVLNQISEFSKSLQSAIGDANGKAKEALEQSRSNIEKAVQELRQAHPEVEQQAAALRDKLQSAVQTTVQETQKIAKEVAANVEETNKKLEPQIKKAYEDFVKQAEQVQQKLHEAANKQ